MLVQRVAKGKEAVEVGEVQREGHVSSINSASSGARGVSCYISQGESHTWSTSQFGGCTPCPLAVTALEWAFNQPKWHDNPFVTHK